jgi:hypothetical protein
VTATAAQIAAAERLIHLVTPTELAANQQIAAWHGALSKADEYIEPAWLLNEVLDWAYGYKVDWKDSDSFVRCVVAIASNWKYELTLGVENPLDEAFLSGRSVPELMALACDELAGAGLTLWNWNTESDCFCGWISRSSVADAVAREAQALGVDLRPANQAY